MDFRKADQRISKNPKISIVLPAASSGVGVSRQTGQSSEEPEPSFEVAISIEVPGELGSFAVDGEDAATIYKIIRQHLAD